MLIQSLPNATTLTLFPTILTSIASFQSILLNSDPKATLKLKLTQEATMTKFKLALSSSSRTT